MAIQFPISSLFGIAMTLTLFSLIKTNSEKTGNLVPSDQQSCSSALVESIVDTRFKLLAASFQNQIDVLHTKVDGVQSSKRTRMERIKGQHQHSIKKRQTNTSKAKRLINFENINSSCIFYYPDYPDFYQTNSKFNSTETNQIKNDRKTDKFQTQKTINNKTQKSTRPICENSSSFCTYLHPDHPNAGRKTDASLNTNSPTVSNEHFKNAKNENGMTTIYSTTDYPTTNRKISEATTMVTNEILQSNSKVTGMPTSCMDLQLLGHKLNGFYLIKTSRPTQGMKIETIFCDFQSPLSVSGIFQSLIGSVKITTKNTFFYVQRHNPFFQSNAVILWELERLNEGGAFNMATGVFTAPVPGIYHFEFHGVKDYHSYYLDIILQLNETTYASASTNHGNSTGSFDGVSLSVSLRLKANDRVNMFNWQNHSPFPPGALFDIAHLHVTHFTGWLLEEDIM